jgi:hypothetical protein
VDFKELILENKAGELSNAEEYFSNLPLKIADSVKEVFAKYGAIRLKSNSIFISEFETEIERIFGISSDPNYSLSQKITIYHLRLPKNQIPLAHLAGGDMFTIDADSGSIQLWLHEEDDEYQLRKMRKKLKLVAPSFPALISMINSTPLY